MHADYRTAVLAAYRLLASARDPEEAAGLLNACRAPLQERLLQLIPDLEHQELFPLLDSARVRGHPTIFEGVWAGMIEWEFRSLLFRLRQDPSLVEWRDLCDQNIGAMESLLKIENSSA